MAKDAYYFKHLSNSRNDPKHIVMISEWGMTGYGLFWVIIEILRESTRYRLEDKEYNWLAIAHQAQLPVDKVKQFVQDCHTKYDLLTMEDGFIFSMTLLHIMDQLECLRDKRRRAAEHRWNNE